jgi:tetratricopeptide (TPR) repeat protein/TolB-like protein
MDEPKARPERQHDDAADAAVRTPMPGESSSAEHSPLKPQTDPNDLPFDAPTMLDVDATMVDIDATLVDHKPAARQAGPKQGSPGRMVSGLWVSAAVLNPGDVLGGRYEILQLLGEGGMGAVYKARDRELDRFVALKLIRPELAQSPAILARFKQELLLAHQVTHKNVIRIYDLGEADGVRFITMEFIQGADLRHLLHANGKYEPAAAVKVIRQVCLALEAAHSVGVIHRDLKPQNIMVDSQDPNERVLVMDFGLARSIESEGMTQTGALVGTMEYMSPEQALGKDLDQRSDIFALGLIFFELLTGKTPYKADTALASLIKRNQERAIPAVELEPSIPQGLSDIVARCLERDLSLRYLTVQEIMTDLDAWEGKKPISATYIRSVVLPPAAQPARSTLPWKWIGAGALVLALGVGGWLVRGKLMGTAGTNAVRGPVTSLAILPFRNASGDPSLDWLGASLADMLSTDVGQSARLRTISPDRLHQILTDLQITGNVAVDPNMLKRVAEFSNADTVVWGQYAKFGEQIRIDATLQDLKHDRRVPLKIEVPSEKDVPGSVDKLAEMIRQNLGMSGAEIRELQATSFQPTSKSMTALRAYNEGVELMREGKAIDAQKKLEDATKEDPEFALAFAKLAQTYISLGYDTEAEQAAQRAVERSEGLPAAEKYLITAIRAQVTNNYPEAIKAYEALAQGAPDNADVLSALGRLYDDSGDYAKAEEYYQRVLAANPKDLNAIIATGRVNIHNGKSQDALEPLNRALSLAIQLGNDEQRATSLHLIGLAYRRLNKPEEALRNAQEALAIRRKIGDKRGIAFSLNEMALSEVSLGKPTEALAHYQESLQIMRDIGDKRGLGDTLINLGNFYDDRGDHDQALKMYKEALQLEREVGNEGLQAVCLNNIGAAYYEKAQYEDARTYYQQALQLREKAKVPQDIVDSIHNLAETSVRMGQYDQAVTEYMKALDLRRSLNDARGAAIESYTLGVMFEHQGRFGAAINSKQEALKAFQGLQDKTNWMADISSGYGEALILGGRGDEAQPFLDDALKLARELKNDGLVAQAFGFQGDAAYYRGDYKQAAGLYQQSLQAATQSKEPDRILTAKVNLAKAAIEDGRAAQGVAAMRPLMKQAEEQGVAHVALECSIYIAQAMAQGKDYAHAKPELERALARADKIGLKPLSMRAHYLLGNVLRATGNRAEAGQHYRSAKSMLDDMKSEPGAGKLLQRTDFKTIAEESAHWAQ